MTAQSTPSEVERPVIEHYERQLAEHGPTARGMDWRDAASQALRFDVLCEGLPLDGLHLHEEGCGAGHLLDHLRARGHGARYTGSDLSAAMLAEARRRHPEGSFTHRGVLEPAAERADFVVCSGLFHVKTGNRDSDWRRFIEQGLARMYERCRVAIAFNLMSDQVDYRSENLHYANPGELLDYCRRTLSRRVALRHDYPLYEFTIHVYRDRT